MTQKERSPIRSGSGFVSILNGVARGGVEPPTYRFSGGRSYQLSYLAAETRWALLMRWLDRTEAQRPVPSERS
jgi:hypothetical protein